MDGNKGWNFLDKVILQSPRVRLFNFISDEEHLDIMCTTKSKYLRLGGILGKVLTLDQVKKRDWALANRCYFCQAEEESIDHLFIHCEKTRALREMLFTLFRVSWVFPSSVRETLLGWNGFFVGKRRKIVWRVSPLCIFWTV